MQGITEGTILGGRYELEDRLAHRGEDLEYWSARDTTLQRDVAITCLLAQGEFADAAQAALDGARRSAGVDDPRLVRVLDVGTDTLEDTEVSYIVEESLGDAESLADLVLDGPVTPEEARRLVGEAAVALDVAGRRGLHHQQLTPYALLRTAGGAVKVSGIATAAVLDEVEEMSAEDASRLDTEDLVALLYTALTGRWPGVDLPDLEPALVKGGGPVPPVTVAPDVPGDLDALCREVLRRDSGPATPGELARRLSPWSADEVTPGRPYSAPSTAQVTPEAEDEQTRDLGGAVAAAAGAAAAAAATRKGTEASDGADAAEGTEDGTTDAPAAGGAAGSPDPGRTEAARDDDAADAAAEDDDFEDPWADELPPAATAATAQTARPARTRSYHEPDDAAEDPDRDVAAFAATGAGGAGYAAADEDPEDERPRGSGARTGLVFALLIALLAVAGFLGFRAVQGLFGGGEDDEPDPAPPAQEEPVEPGDEETTTAPEPEATEETSEPAGPLEIADVISYDPQGDDNERNDLIGNLADGDPDTAWNTRRYLSLPWGGIKDGVGVEVDLGETATVSEVDVVFDDDQFSGDVAGEVYVGDEPDLDAMTEIGSTDGSRGTWTTTAEEPVEGRYVIVWFTDPGQNDAGEGYLAVTEIEVR